MEHADACCASVRPRRLGRASCSRRARDFAIRARVSRLDAFFARDDGGLRFTEYNAETPAGAGVQRRADGALPRPAGHARVPARATTSAAAARAPRRAARAARCLRSSCSGTRALPRRSPSSTGTRCRRCSEFLLFQRLLPRAGRRRASSPTRARCEYRRRHALYAGGDADRPDLQAGADPRAGRATAGSTTRSCARCATARSAWSIRSAARLLHKKASLAVLSDERNAQLFIRRRAAGDRGAHSLDARRRGAADRRIDGEDDRSRSRSSPNIASGSCSSRTTTTAAPASCWAGRSTPRPGSRAIAERAGRAVHRAGADRARRRSRIPSVVDGRVQVIGPDASTPRRSSRHGEYVDGCLTRISTAALVNVTAGGGSRPCRPSSWRTTVRDVENSMKPPSLTIGIEEEYQIIDPETRELAVLHHRDPEGRSHGAGRGEAGAAPVDGRGRHQGLPHAGRSCAPSWCGCAGW